MKSRRYFPFIAAFALMGAACATQKVSLISSLDDVNREDRGWYGADANRDPRGLDAVPVAPWRPQDIALSSPGCARPFRTWDPPRWQEARSRCAAYRQTDVFISLGEDHRRGIDEMAGAHPWMQNGMEDRVRVYHPRSMREIQRMAAGLMMECKVVRRLVVATHGIMGELLVGDGLVTTSQLFADGLSPCLFTPGSQVQVTACLQACPQVLESVRVGLESVFLDQRFLARSSSAPFEGLRMLMNSDEGSSTTPNSPRWIRSLFGGPARTTEVSTNGVAVEYQVAQAHFQADETASRLPACRACHSRGPVLRVNEDVRHRLEDPWRDQSYVMTAPQVFLQERRRENQAISCPGRGAQSAGSASFGGSGAARAE